MSLPMIRANEVRVNLFTIESVEPLVGGGCVLYFVSGRTQVVEGEEGEAILRAWDIFSEDVMEHRAADQDTSRPAERAPLDLG